MLKKILPVSAIALAALVSSAFAQDTIALDVIIRDFPVGHTGFEAFDIDKKLNGECLKPEGSKHNGSVSDCTPNSEKNTGNANQMCVKDNRYIYCDEDRNARPLCYGQNLGDGDANRKRGYFNGPDKNNELLNNASQADDWKKNWANTVWVSRGMVENDLDYSQCGNDDWDGDPSDPQYLRGRYCARPYPSEKSRNDNLCYGKNLHDWFTNGGSARTIDDDVIKLARKGNLYEIEYDYNTRYNWNGDGNDNGYFPLDKYDDSRTYGKESLNLWCPWENPGYDLGADCQAWKDLGRDVWPKATRNFANSRNLLSKLHNYGFTMAGNGKFKYNEGSNDEFNFVGDDDMWIFIDGKLAADLGGTHTAAPAKINIGDYARKEGVWRDRDGDVWQNGSFHVVNFYYADRQTDGSNLKISMALTDLAPPRNGPPYIMEAKTTQSQDGSSKTTIFVNTQLDEDILNKFRESGDQFPIIINKSGSDQDVQGFKINTWEYIGIDNGRHAYEITGEVCKNKNECGGSLLLNSGDSLSFNTIKANIEDEGYKDPGGLALPCSADQVKNSQCEWIVRSKTRAESTTLKWGRNTTSMAPIKFNPEIANPDPRKPDFDMNAWFSGGGGNGDGSGNFGNSAGNFSQKDPTSAGGSGPFPNMNQVWDPETGAMVSNSGVANSQGNISGFGSKGTPIPPNMAGELLLTAFPNPTNNVNGMSYKEWQESETAQKIFGLPSGGNGEVYGIADPSNDKPGYAFVKNGFGNESSVNGKIQVAPTRCISDEGTDSYDPDNPKVNCLNFSLLAKQPFLLAVTVYDQLGNFVTQYRETVRDQEFRNVVQGPNYINGSGADRVVPSDGCSKPNERPELGYGHPDVLTTNGLVKVNVNIYPFSKDGRRIGNGVYIAKIDRVDLPYEGCMNNNGAAVRIQEPYTRYHADAKFGWMRTGSKSE